MNNIFKSISKISLPVFVSLVFLFLYIPIVILVFFSFTDSSAPVFLGTKSFSLKWYYALLESPEILEFSLEVALCLVQKVFEIPDPLKSGKGREFIKLFNRYIYCSLTCL